MKSMTAEEFLKVQIPFEAEALEIQGLYKLSYSDQSTFIQVLGQSRIQKLKIDGIELYRLTSDWWLELRGLLKSARLVCLDKPPHFLYQLTSEQWSILGRGLKAAGVQQLEQLDLSDTHLCKLTPEQWLAMGEAFKIAGVEGLGLDSNVLCLLTPEKMNALSQALANLPTLRRLNLEENGLSLASSEAPSLWINAISASKNLESLTIEGIPIEYVRTLIDRLDFLYQVNCEHPYIQQLLQRKTQVFLEKLIQGTLPKDWNDEKIARIGALIEKNLFSLFEKKTAWVNNFLTSLEKVDFEESAVKNKVIARVLASLQATALSNILYDSTINISSDVIPETIRFVMTPIQILDQLNGNNASAQKAFETLLRGCKESPSDMPRLWNMIRSIQAQDPKEKNFWDIFQTSLVRSQAHTWPTEVKDLLASHVIGLDVSTALQKSSPAPQASSAASAAEPSPRQNKEEKVPPLSDYACFALALCSEDSPLYMQLGTQLLGLKLPIGETLDPLQKTTLAQKVAMLRAELGMTGSPEQTSQAGPGSPGFFKAPASDQSSAPQGDSPKEEAPPKTPGQFG